MTETTMMTPIEKELLRELNEGYGTAMELRNRIIPWLQAAKTEGAYLTPVQEALSNLCRKRLVTVAYIEDKTYFEIAIDEAAAAELLAA